MKIYIIPLLVVMANAEDLSVESNSSVIELNTTSSSDSINFCLGISKKNLKYCSLIKDKDEKSACFGIVKRNSGYCTMVKDEDIKNRCLSIALSDISYCDKIEDKDLKESCQALYKESESESDREGCK